MAFIEGYITTPEFPDLDEVQLQDPGTYRIAAVGPGPLTWRRSEATSAYVHGATLVAAAKENSMATLSILVEGDTPADLETNKGLLLRLFEQFTYRIHITLRGQEHFWQCFPADYQVSDSGDYDGNLYRLTKPKQLYTFRIPRLPTALDGVE